MYNTIDTTNFLYTYYLNNGNYNSVFNATFNNYLPKSTSMTPHVTDINVRTYMSP
jgi:hypothetical protein